MYINGFYVIDKAWVRFFGLRGGALNRPENSHSLALSIIVEHTQDHFR